MDDPEINRTIYAGNLSDKVSEDVLFELGLQAGPVEKVKIPHDRNTGNKKNFGFLCFQHECTVPYAVHMLNGIRLCDKNINIQSRNKAPLAPCDLVGIHSVPDVTDDDDFMKESLDNNGRITYEHNNLSSNLQKRLGKRIKHSEVTNEYPRYSSNDLGSDGSRQRRERESKRTPYSTNREDQRSKSTRNHKDYQNRDRHSSHQNQGDYNNSHTSHHKSHGDYYRSDTSRHNNGNSHGGHNNNQSSSYQNNVGYSQQYAQQYQYNNNMQEQQLQHHYNGSHLQQQQLYQGYHPVGNNCYSNYYQGH